MRAGERCTYDGYEVCLFPLDYLYITQTSSPQSFSHCCGHPCDYIGTTAYYPYYAPFTCTRIWSDSATDVAYVSDDKVWTPSGLSYVTICFTHDESIPAPSHYNQGDLIGHTGQGGYAFGDHVHIDQSKVRNAYLINSGITCSGGNQCYMLDGSEYPYDIFYLSGSETVVQTQGYTFETWHDSPITESHFKWWMSRMLLYRRRNGL